MISNIKEQFLLLKNSKNFDKTNDTLSQIYCVNFKIKNQPS